MRTLEGKKILLGVCGGIAAYKAAFLVRLLVKAGADVQVIMTPDATQFITPLTLSTLSGKPVYQEFFDQSSGVWNNHVHMALWADALVVAPATAHTLGKMAHGICDNLLIAAYLSAKSPVFLAPAMDLDMWRHGSTQSNLLKLQAFGNLLIPPGHGDLASGLVGEGRMAEPEEILQALELHFGQGEPESEVVRSLVGRTVLVTAGPTYEAIDPVRFIGNHSSGKMGVELAKCLLVQGARVLFVHGPIETSLRSQLPIEEDRFQVKSVTSASEMAQACLCWAPQADAVIMAAAVADYTPSEVSDTKIKKVGEDLSLSLKRTQDILKTLGEQKQEGQVLVGFALETDNELAHAQDKMQRKNLDYIVLNSLRDPGAGFGVDTNQVTILSREGSPAISLGLKSKSDVAADIISHTLVSLYRPSSS